MNETLYVLVAHATRLAATAASAAIRDKRVNDPAIMKCVESFEAIAQALDALDTPNAIESAASYRMMAARARNNLRHPPAPSA